MPNGLNGLLSFNYSLKEFKEDLFAEQTTVLFLFLLSTGLFGVWINFNETIALVYSLMGFFALVAIFAEKSNPKLINVILFGKPTKAMLGIMLGAIIGWFFVSTGQVVIGAPPKLATAGTFDFLYVVIAAGFIETIFFFGVLNPTIIQYMENFVEPTVAVILGTGIGSVFFGAFHFLAYGGATTLMIAAFIFSVLATIFSYFFRTQGFATSWHFINNWLVWIK